MTHCSIFRLFSSTFLAAMVLGCGDNVPDVGPSTGLLLVDPPFAAFLPGATKQLDGKLNGDQVPVTWESSDPTIVTVSGTGLVTAVASGSASVTATLTRILRRGAPPASPCPSCPLLTSGVAVTGLSSGNAGAERRTALPDRGSGGSYCAHGHLYGRHG